MKVSKSRNIFYVQNKKKVVPCFKKIYIGRIILSVSFNINMFQDPLRNIPRVLNAKKCSNIEVI